jgi:nucleoside-diphosphate-sugar epimerase
VKNSPNGRAARCHDVKALVTGGGGFLGLAIVRGLIKRGASVRSFSRQDHGALRELGVEQHRGDLADVAAVSNAVAGCDIVFHVAAKAGVWGPYDEYHRINVTGTENVIAACRRHGVSRLVHTSSPSVVFAGGDMEGVDESVPYPDHYEAHYPATKAAAEQRVRAANGGQLATVALRPHLIWGPGDNHLLPRMIARARAGQLRRIGKRNTRIDTVYIDDAAEAHMLAADRLSPGSSVSGKVYFISQGEPVDTWDMINRLLGAAGLAPVDRTVPVGLAMAMAWCFETTHKVLGISAEPRLTRFVIRELTTSHWFNIGAARRDLGYSPSISINEGLRRLLENLRK